MACLEQTPRQLGLPVRSERTIEDSEWNGTCCKHSRAFRQVVSRCV